MKGFFVLLFVLVGAVPAFAQPEEGQYLNRTGVSVDVSRGLVYGRAAGVNLTLDAYVPHDTKNSRPAVLWIHGGGFTSGNKEVGPAAEFALELAKRGYVCFSMDYRLDGSIGTGLEDVITAFRWITERAVSLGIDPTRIAVGGDSAGGILSLYAAYSPKSSLRPLAVVNIYGSLVPNAWSKARVPVLTLHGDRDQTISIEAAYSLERNLESKGIPHRFFLMANEGHNVLGRYQDDAVLEIVSFLYTHLNDPTVRTIEPARVVKPGQTVLGFQVEVPGNSVSPVNFVIMRPQGGKPFVIQPLKTVVEKPLTPPLVIPRLSGSVDVDGDLGEWPQAPLFVIDQAGQTVQLPDWKSPEDLSARVWLSWDEDNLYFAAEVTSAGFHQTKAGADIWQEDSVQVAVDARPFAEASEAPNEGYTELGLAWNTVDQQNEFFRWIFPESQIGEPWMGTVRVVPRGKKTFYEAAFPWQNLGAEDLREGRPLQFSLLVNHLGANKIRGWIEYGSGVGRSKDASLFVKAVLQ